MQANLIQLAFQICHFGSIFLIGMYLQVSAQMSAMVAGLIMGMQAIGAICTSRYSVRLFNQFGPGFPIIIGFIGIGIITPCILFITVPKMIFFGALILFVRGLFSGLCGTPIQTSSIIGFQKNDVGRASAIFNASRQISISLGIALSSLLISYGFKSYGVNTAHTYINKAVFYDAFILISFVSLCGIIAARQVDNKSVLSLIEQEK